jgi:hypothetical protein
MTGDFWLGIQWLFRSNVRFYLSRDNDVIKDRQIGWERFSPREFKLSIGTGGWSVKMILLKKNKFYDLNANWDAVR